MNTIPTQHLGRTIQKIDKSEKQQTAGKRLYFAFPLYIRCGFLAVFICGAPVLQTSHVASPQSSFIGTQLEGLETTNGAKFFTPLHQIIV